jgi:hypothetical protein
MAEPNEKTYLCLLCFVGDSADLVVELSCCCGAGDRPRRPEASNLNYVSGSVVANLVTVRPGVDGKVCIYSYATSGLLADVAGYFPAGSSFVPVNNPERILDTRTGLS